MRRPLLICGSYMTLHSVLFLLMLPLFSYGNYQSSPLIYSSILPTLVDASESKEPPIRLCYYNKHAELWLISYVSHIYACTCCCSTILLNTSDNSILLNSIISATYFVLNSGEELTSSTNISPVDSRTLRSTRA